MARSWTVEGLGADTEVGQAAAKILSVRLAEVRSYCDATVLRTDPEDLHDLRVATRRLRAALRLVGGRLAQAERAVKALGDALGRVRDIDVMIEWLERERNRDDAPSEQPGIDALIAEQRRALPPLEAAMREAIDRHRVALEPVLLAQLDGWRVPSRRTATAKPAAARSPTKRLGGRTIRRAVARRFRRLGDRIERLSSITDAAAVHAIRIAGKKARYDLELIEPVLGEPVLAALGRLKRLQDLVGEVRDRDVRLALLPERVAHAAPAELPDLVRLLRAAFDERRRHGEALRVELDGWKSGAVAEELATLVLES